MEIGIVIFKIYVDNMFLLIGSNKDVGDLLVFGIMLNL